MHYFILTQYIPINQKRQVFLRQLRLRRLLFYKATHLFYSFSRHELTFKANTIKAIQMEKMKNSKVNELERKNSKIQPKKCEFFFFFLNLAIAPAASLGYGPLEIGCEGNQYHSFLVCKLYLIIIFRSEGCYKDEMPGTWVLHQYQYITECSLCARHYCRDWK